MLLQGLCEGDRRCGGSCNGACDSTAVIIVVASVGSTIVSRKSREKDQMRVAGGYLLRPYIREEGLKETKQIKLLSYGHRERKQTRGTSLPVGPGMRNIKGKLGKEWTKAC